MKYILGSGITALTLLELKPDYIALRNSEENVGGQLAFDFKLGPRILHQTPEVDIFLKRIGIEAESKQFKVKYISNNKEVENPSFSDITDYTWKTRRTRYVSESYLNGGKKFFYGYDIKEIKLMEKLLERNGSRIKNEVITELDIFDKRINGRPYEDLISTIDAFDFSKISRIGKPSAIYNYKRGVYFTYVRPYAIYNKIFDFGDAEFIYFLNHPYFNRATKNGDCIVIESNSFLNHSRLLSFGLKKIEEVCMKSQIIKEMKMSSIAGITLAGRYAQYDHSVKLDTIIKRFMEDANGAENLHI